MNYLFPRDAINTMNNSMNNSMNNTMNNSMNNSMNTKTIKQSLNKFFDIPNTTNYNTIYYQNQKEKKLCDKDEHAHIPCKKTCNADEDYTLSDSELAFLYKYAYEEAGKEILMRKLNEDETA